MRYRITPLREMYSWRDVLIFFRDIDGGWHDATGSIVKETEDFLVVANREDKQVIEVDRKYVEFIEEVT